MIFAQRYLQSLPIVSYKFRLKTRVFFVHLRKFAVFCYILVKTVAKRIMFWYDVVQQESSRSKLAALF